MPSTNTGLGPCFHSTSLGPAVEKMTREQSPKPRFVWSFRSHPPPWQLKAPTTPIHQDMTALLSHYFIYMSHNTYLTGNQISSDSSDIPIIRALQRGAIPVDGKEGPADVCVIELGGTVGDIESLQRERLVNMRYFSVLLSV